MHETPFCQFPPDPLSEAIYLTLYESTDNAQDCVSAWGMLWGRLKRVFNALFWLKLQVGHAY